FPSWPRAPRRCLPSCLESLHLRIIKRARPAPGCIGVPKRLDFKRGFGREFGGQVAEGNGLAERVPVADRCRGADYPAFMKDRLSAVQRREAVDGERTELARDAFCLNPLQRVATDEIALVECNGETEAGLVRIVVRRNIAGPVEIALLHPAGIDGSITCIGNAMPGTGLAQNLINMRCEFLRNIEFPAEFPDIADTYGERVSVAHFYATRGEEGESVIRHVFIGGG